MALVLSFRERGVQIIIVVCLPHYNWSKFICLLLLFSPIENANEDWQCLAAEIAPSVAIPRGLADQGGAQTDWRKRVCENLCYQTRQKYLPILSLKEHLLRTTVIWGQGSLSLNMSKGKFVARDQNLFRACKFLCLSLVNFRLKLMW